MVRTRRILATLLAVVIIASMAVPAFAAVENAEKAVKLQTIGLMAGGINDLNLDGELNRIQGLTFAIRAAGKEAEALAMSDSEVNSILANVVDRGDIPNWANGYAQKYVAYAVKHKYTLGMDSTILPKVKFGPMKSISGTSFMVFLMKSGMGYSNVTTENVIEKAIEAKIITVSEAGKYGSKPELIRDDASGILFGAAMNGINADGKTLIQSLIESGFVTRENAINAGFIKDDVSNLSLQAIGARKLQVSFGKAVDTSKIIMEVKRGANKPTVRSTTYADDKKSAVIEFNTDMSEGEYTVTVNGLSSSALTASTIVKAPTLTAIEFQSAYAIKKGYDITARVSAENQYGEDMTSRLNSATVVVYPQGSSISILNGLITARGTSSDFYKENSKVVITVIDTTSNISKSETLTVSASAAIESITFGELTTDDTTLKGKDINVESMSLYASKYYLPITVKDQYGNILKADELSGLTLLNSDPTIVQFASTKLVNDSRYGTVLKFQNVTNGKAGLAVITAIGMKSGGDGVVTVSKSINILDNPKIDQIYLSAPSGNLKLNSTAVLPITVVDIYQRQIELKDISFTSYGTSLVLNGSTTINAFGATLRTEKNVSTGETKIIITPTSNSIVLMATSATGKTTTLNLTALNAPVASDISGLKSDFASMLVVGSSSPTLLKGNVLFTDQYGDEIAAPTYKAVKSNGSTPYYTISKLNTSSTVTSFDISTGAIYAGSNQGSDIYIVELFDQNSNLLDTMDVTVRVIRMEDITSYVIGDLNKFYTGTIAGDYSQQIKLYGVVGNQKVEIDSGIIAYITASGDLGKGISSTGLYTKAVVDTDGKDQTSTITVLLNNGMQVQKTVTYSSAAPKAQSLEIKYNGTKVTSNQIQIPRAAIEGKSLVGTGGTTDGLLFEAKDQYGKYVTSSSYNFIVTGKETSGTVTTSGIATGFVASDSGKSLQLNVFVGDYSKTLKVIIE